MSIVTPDTTTALDHGLEIYANGNLLGGIAQWSWSQNMENKRVRAYGNKLVGVNSAPAKRGEPFENVGGNMTNVTIQFQRLEIWTEPFAEAFGLEDGVISVLNRPLLLKAAVDSPDGKTWNYLFWGSRIDTFSQAHDVNGDHVIRGSGTISVQAMRIYTPRGNALG